MKSNIFIPQKINVGFQNRSDTYTKKLAYIIYFDQKGVLRKERSWEGWRDDNIPNVICENVPTSGFVLNKKVGDYDSGWNHRHAYCRVYDPRDFEFEITIENLLYILENTSSIKGKGLEGEFVYGWDGKDLVLIPVDSPDYKEIFQFNTIIHSNNFIKSKDLILGATYKTKQNEEWIYMGRFDYWDTETEKIEKDVDGSSNYYSGWNRNKQYDFITKDVNKGKYYYFAHYYKYSWSKEQDEPYLKFEKIKNLGDKFIDVISSECTEKYAELFDKLEHITDYSPLDKTKEEYIKYPFEEFYEKLNNNKTISCYNQNKNNFYVYASKTLEQNQCYCEDRQTWRKTSGTVEEIYNMLQPTYKREYLQNGKLYKEDK